MSKKIGILVRPHTSPDDLESLIHSLQKAGHTIVYTSSFQEHSVQDLYIQENTIPTLYGIEILISYGGDGTALTAARMASKNNIPVLAIHKGNIGFLAEFSDTDIPSILYALDHPNLEPRNMVAGWVEHANQSITERFIALNDVSIYRSSTMSLIKWKLIVDQQEVYVGRGDGFLVSTPTGSTAYNLTAGGPILSTDLAALALTPICPQGLSNKPVVISNTHHVDLQIMDHNEAIVCFDGQQAYTMAQGDTLRIQPAQFDAKFLMNKQPNIFSTLQNKLGWNHS